MSKCQLHGFIKYLWYYSIKQLSLILLWLHLKPGRKCNSLHCDGFVVLGRVLSYLVQVVFVRFCRCQVQEEIPSAGQRSVPSHLCDPNRLPPKLSFPSTGETDVLNWLVTAVVRSPHIKISVAATDLKAATVTIMLNLLSLLEGHSLQTCLAWMEN